MVSPVLIFMHGPRAGERLTLAADEHTLGRRARNEVALDDPLVSRVHAIIMRRGGATLIEDLGSHNGTYVNGERLSAIRQLHHGDKITVGASKIEFEDPTDAVESQTQISAPEAFGGATLTNRQIQVLRLMARGLSNKQIGERIYVSERTVKAYVSSIFEKLQVQRRAAAVAAALKLGLIDQPRDDDTWS
ncbi:MAG TPA: FHA domain-containing protein [Actinomycetota bacterium]